MNAFTYHYSVSVCDKLCNPPLTLKLCNCYHDVIGLDMSKAPEDMPSLFNYVILKFNYGFPVILAGACLFPNNEK